MLSQNIPRFKKSSKVVKKFNGFKKCQCCPKSSIKKFDPSYEKVQRLFKKVPKDLKRVQRCSKVMEINHNVTVKKFNGFEKIPQGFECFKVTKKFKGCY